MDTYEKKYKEALERASNLHKDAVEMENNMTTKTCEIIFPEVKESENIKIIKAIKYGLDHVFTNNTTVFEVTKKQCLAWLEAQGEHANFRNKIQIGDKVTRNEDGVLVNLSQLNRVAKKDEKQGEQKLNVNDNAKEMFIKALERVEEQNAKGYKLTDCDKNSWWEDFKAYTTSKQILANSAKTCKDEQKPAWSEEDEKMFEHIIAKATLHFSSINYLDEEEINFLKSLRPQNTWKPSDEQMSILWDALCTLKHENYKHLEIIKSLHQDLKKLKK